MNSASAVVYCSRLMRKLMKNTSPSVPSISTIIGGPPKIIWPNGVSAAIVPPAIRMASPPAVEGEPGHDAGQRHRRRHVVVDADHVGAQARIDRGRPVGEAAAGRYVPIEIRHCSFPL